MCHRARVAASARRPTSSEISSGKGAPLERGGCGLERAPASNKGAASREIAMREAASSEAALREGSSSEVASSEVASSKVTSSVAGLKEGRPEQCDL